MSAAAYSMNIGGRGPLRGTPEKIPKLPDQRTRDAAAQVTNWHLLVKVQGD